MNHQTPISGAVEATETITAPETATDNDHSKIGPQKRSQRLTPPEGCRHCGLEAREHVQRWTKTARWHGYVEPTTEQVLQRIRDRRATTAPQAPQDAPRSTQMT